MRRKERGGGAERLVRGVLTLILISSRRRVSTVSSVYGLVMSRISGMEFSEYCTEREIERRYKYRQQMVLILQGNDHCKISTAGVTVRVTPLS